MSEITRCQAAHADDPSLCQGPHDAVTVLDAHNAGATGCEHHAARLLASLDGARVYSGPVGKRGAAIRVFEAAQDIRPFPWLTDAPPTRPDQPARSEQTPADVLTPRYARYVQHALTCAHCIAHRARSGPPCALAAGYWTDVLDAGQGALLSDADALWGDLRRSSDDADPIADPLYVLYLRHSLKCADCRGLPTGRCTDGQALWEQVLTGWRARARTTTAEA